MTYGESIIINYTGPSGLAADIWPGRNVDKARFVELLKLFTPETCNVTRINISLLISSLLNNSRKY